MRIFSVGLMVLVGAVFLSQPASLIANRIEAPALSGIAFGSFSWLLLIILGVILIDLLSGSQDVSSILLNGSDRFHHGLLHTQCGRGHVGIGLLRILAGQQLEAGRAEQHPAHKQGGSFMEIHHYGVHLTFSGAGTR